MKALKLLDSNHFLRYGGKEHILVLKLNSLHSPHVKEQDWKIIESVGIGSQYKHDSLQIFDHVIQGQDFKNLALDLLQSRLFINREGYCYLESEILPSSSSPNTSSFNSIQYYRINDLFGWSKYKVTPKITMVWNRREVERGHIIINYEDKDKTSPELLNQISDLQQKVDSLINITKNNNTQSSSSLTSLQPQTFTPTTTPITTTTTTTTTTQQPPSVPLSMKGPYTFDTEDLYDRIIRYCRKPDPDQFVFEIESYEELKQSLKKAKCTELETPRFHAAHLDWTLCIYLEGNHEDDGDGYLSLYLKRHSDRYNQAVNIKLLLRFFVYNFDHKEYVTIQELAVTNFDDVKDSKKGMAKALKIKDLEDKVNNGLIRGDKCRFGVEIFSLQSHPSVAKSLMIQNFDSNSGICHFNDYSTLPKDVPSYSDDVFKTFYYINDQSRKYHYTWKVELYPHGKGRERSKSVSVYLELINKQDLSSGRLFVNYEIRLKHKDNGKDHIKNGYAWFTYEHYNNGFENFISLDDFQSDNSTNYVIKDTVTIEVYFNKFFELKKEL